MGCCQSEDAVAVGTPNQQSLLVAEQISGQDSRASTSVSARSTAATRPAEAPVEAVHAAQRGDTEQAAQPPSSPVPVGSTQTKEVLTPRDFGVNAASPGDSSVSSWDGEGGGVWRVCNGDVSPNPLTSIKEDNNAEEEEARGAVSSGASKDSPFFRSVASAETSPAVQSGTSLDPSHHASSPNVLSSIMQEKSLNGGGFARNPMVGNQDMTPSLDGSPFFRSVSSIDGGTPGGANERSDYVKSNPLSLGFEMDDGSQVWQDSGGADIQPA